MRSVTVAWWHHERTLQDWERSRSPPSRARRGSPLSGRALSGHQHSIRHHPPLTATVLTPTRRRNHDRAEFRRDDFDGVEVGSERMKNPPQPQEGLSPHGVYWNEHAGWVAKPMGCTAAVGRRQIPALEKSAVAVAIPSVTIARVPIAIAPVSIAAVTGIPIAIAAVPHRSIATIAAATTTAPSSERLHGRRREETDCRQRDCQDQASHRRTPFKPVFRSVNRTNQLIHIIF